jgi:hypothetical protein
MKNKIGASASSELIANETKMVAEANPPSSLHKNAEQNKEVAERCREVRMQLEKAMRIL